MNKAELISKLADDAGITKTQANAHTACWLDHEFVATTLHCKRDR